MKTKNTISTLVLLITHCMIFSAHPAINWCDKSAKAQGTTNQVLRQIYNSYDYHSCFSDGYAVVKKNGRYGFVDTKGNVVIQLKYHHVAPFHHGLAPAAIEKDQKKKYGFINTSGKWAIPPTYDDASTFKSDRAAVGKIIGKQMRYGYINPQGKQIIGYKYDDAAPFFRRGYLGTTNDKKYIVEAIVTKKEKGKAIHYLIDQQGELTTPVGSESNTLSFSSGLALVKTNGLYGFINRQGTFIVPPKYLNAYPFHSSGQPAAIRDPESGNWGFVDNNGIIVLPFVYYHAHSFKNGKASITQPDGHTRQEINLKGEVVTKD